MSTVMVQQTFSIQRKVYFFFFDNWIQSGFRYVVDIVDENGIKPIEWFYENLRRKRNILCEYKIISHIFRKLKHLNFKYLPYQNLRMKPNFEITSLEKSINITEVTSKMMYNIFVKKKFHVPKYQSFYCRIFKIHKSSWSQIYKICMKEKLQNLISNY